MALESQEMELVVDDPPEHGNPATSLDAKSEWRFPVGKFDNEIKRSSILHNFTQIAIRRAFQSKSAPNAAPVLDLVFSIFRGPRTSPC